MIFSRRNICPSAALLAVSLVAGAQTWTEVRTGSELAEAIQTDGGAFIGTFKPVTLWAEEGIRFYLGADNKLLAPQADVEVNAFRGYIEVEGADIQTDSIGSQDLNME